MTQTRYRIRPGASFRLPDGTLATEGDVIALDSDVAANHAGKVEPITEPAFDAPLPVIDTGPA